MADKHTSGPWIARRTIDAHDGFPDCWQIDAEMDAVCTTQFCAAPETEANARLIAAAPDLLSALKAMVMNDRHTYRDCHKAAVAAIAKAAGQ